MLHWHNRTYRVTREQDTYRSGDPLVARGAILRLLGVECGSLTVEVHRFDETDPPHKISGWWVARVQD